MESAKSIDVPVEPVPGAGPSVPDPPLEPSAGLTSRSIWANRLFTFVETWGVLIVFALVLLTFSLLSPKLFPTWSNISTIFEQTGIVILLGVGLTFVLAAGEFDLSFPNLFVLVSGVTVAAMTKGHIGVVPAVLLGLVTGAIGGAVNGIVVASQRASSFIVTLALGSVYTGIMIAIAGPSPIVAGIPAGYSELAFQIGEVSAVMVISVVVSIIAALVLRATVFGRYVQATGSNPDAAAISGVNVARIRIGAFMILGICVAIAAILQSSLSNAHYPNAGTSLFLPPFVAAFIGTSVLARGRFNVFGTVVGALFISTLQTGLLVQNADSYIIDLLEGLVLLAAVLATHMRGRST